MSTFTCSYNAQNLGSSLAIVLSLAIGIGANTAIFSVIDALLLHPLPYPNPERLGAIWLHSSGIGIFRDWPSPGQYVDLQNENHFFDQMALAQSRNFTLMGREQPERISVMQTQSSLLSMLGAHARMGRLLSADEDHPGKPRWWCSPIRHGNATSAPILQLSAKRLPSAEIYTQ
jgi:hypothetical protein